MNKIVASVKFMDGNCYDADYLVTFSGHTKGHVFKVYNRQAMDFIKWDKSIIPESYTNEENLQKVLDAHAKQFPRLREGE